MTSNNHQHTSLPKCRNKMLKIAEKKKKLNINQSYFNLFRRSDEEGHGK